RMTTCAAKRPVSDKTCIELTAKRSIIAIPCGRNTLARPQTRAHNSRSFSNGSCLGGYLVICATLLSRGPVHDRRFGRRRGRSDASNSRPGRGLDYHLGARPRGFHVFSGGEQRLDLADRLFYLPPSWRARAICF